MIRLQKLIVVLGSVPILFFLAACAGKPMPPPETVRDTEDIVSIVEEPAAETMPPVVSAPPAEPPAELPTEPPTELPAELPAEPPAEVSPESKLVQQLSNFKALPETRVVAVRVFPQDAEAWQLVDTELVLLPAERRHKDTAWFSTAAGALAFRAQDFEPLIVPIPEGSDSGISIKLEFRDSPVRRIAEISTGMHPKSVRFSPDGQYLYTIHLSDSTAIRKYRVEPLEKIQDLNVPPEYAKHEGFVESLILQSRNELWISQMSRSSVHVFGLDSGNYLASVPLSGNWPKILLSSADEDIVYVSCWTSKSVSIIGTESRREHESIQIDGIPRGLSLAPDGRDVLVAQFSDSAVVRLDIPNSQVGTVYDSNPKKINAMRHIVHDSRRKEYYVTAMAAKKVYRLSEEGQWLGYWEVSDNPNTCAISPNGRWLVVSCRGPNNPDTGYLTKGHEFGKIFFINLETGKVEAWIWGQDQPTGLDISPDSQYLAFTNFLSNSLELYRFVDSQAALSF